MKIFYIEANHKHLALTQFTLKINKTLLLRRYARYADDDDECMESNFAQISKEEFISTKCGLLEDLQDIQREKAMLARKKKR